MTGRTLWDVFDDELPDLPYAGTSGYSGTDTSEQRARTADNDGTTGKRQARTLGSLAQAGSLGLTWKELADLHGWHHGTASGSLSVLHRTERIARLTERRNRCKVYVLPKHVDKRPTEPHRGNMTRRASNPREAVMLTERQADVLIAGQPTLINSLAKQLSEPQEPQAQAEAVLETVARWLTQYRPEDLGDVYCTPLDVAAYILRKGEMTD